MSSVRNSLLLLDLEDVRIFPSGFLSWTTAVLFIHNYTSPQILSEIVPE
jgi:hypothetical protein